MKRLILCAALAATVSHAPMAYAETEEAKDLGSRYLRCDGNPNNMTDGESFARLLGAVTLLGLFAPSPEAPDASKRQFGEDGVNVCSELIDGEDSEGNGIRRIPLILARSLHQIEAKNYEAAIADVNKARAEADALGLTGNAYFQRSMGLSPDRIEAAALLRLGRYAEARDVGLRNVDGIKFGFLPLLLSTPFSKFQSDLSPAEETYLAAISRFLPRQTIAYAGRLEEVGRFTEAGKRREDHIQFVEALSEDEIHSSLYVRAALSYALAGDWKTAERHGQFAANQLKSLREQGRPEENATTTVELLDMLEVLRLARDGNMKDARRNFAARSQWVEPGFGVISEATRRLRNGAEESELFGSLSKSAEQLWEERRDEELARLLETDTDNETLFLSVTPYAKISDFERVSKNVWRTKKSKLQLKKNIGETDFFFIVPRGEARVRGDEVTLHAALMAKAQDKSGFVMAIVSSGISAVRYVDSTDIGLDNHLFFNADDVIEELGEIIPSPEELKRRRKAR